MRKIYYGKAVYNNKEIKAVKKVLKNNSLNLIDGPHVKKIEKIVPKLFGKKYGLMVNSGSSANLLALNSLNFKKGSEIITTSLTFSTTIAPIYQLGLTAHFIDVLENKFVDEVIYDRDLISIMNNNLNKIAFWILPASLVFTIIAFLIINSSIRLSIFSNRHTIKTMQMVGATKHFIRYPFIIKNIKLSIISSIIASLGLATLIIYLDNSISLLDMINKVLLFGLFIVILILGVIISWVSTFFATQNILNLNTEKFNF